MKSVTGIALFAMVAFAAAHPLSFTQTEGADNLFAPIRIDKTSEALNLKHLQISFADDVLKHSTIYINNVTSYITRVSEDIKSKSPEVKRIWGNMEGNLSKVVDKMNALMSYISHEKEQHMLDSSFLPLSWTLHISVDRLIFKCDKLAQVLSEESEKATQAVSQSSSEVQKEVAKFTKQADVITMTIDMAKFIVLLSQELPNRQNSTVFISKSVHTRQIPGPPIDMADSLQAHSITYVNNITSYITRVSEDIESKSPEVKRIWEEMKRNVRKVVDDMNVLISNIPKQKAEMLVAGALVLPKSLAFMQSIEQLRLKCDEVAQVLSEESEKAAQAISQGPFEARKDVAKFTEQAVIIAIDIRMDAIMMVLQYFDDLQKSMLFIDEAATIRNMSHVGIIVNAVEARSITFVNNITSYITQVSEDIKPKSSEVKRIWEDMKGNLSKVVNEMRVLTTNVSMQKAQLLMKFEKSVTLLRSVLQLIHKWTGIAEVLSEESAKAAQAISQSSSEARKEVAKFTERADIISINIRLVIVMLHSEYFDSRRISTSAPNESVRTDYTPKYTFLPHIEQFLREEALKMKTMYVENN